MPTSDEVYRQLGNHEARIETLEKALDEFKVENKAMRADIKEMHDLMMQGKGSWKTLAALGGFVAFVSGIVGAVSGFVVGHGGPR